MASKTKKQKTLKLYHWWCIVCPTPINKPAESCPRVVNKAQVIR